MTLADRKFERRMWVDLGNDEIPTLLDDIDNKVQEALGIDNQIIVAKAQEYLKLGDAEALGSLMCEAQANFDRKVVPACTELIAPVLHEILNDENIIALSYGRKGVGSQGDGSVQVLAKNAECAHSLMEYFEKVKGMPSFLLTLHPGQTVRKAVIPLAGFGTRVFPATKCIKKCFLPVLDKNGILKPALLIMLEQLIEAGIEEICLVIGEDEKQEFDSFFGPLSQENYEKLPNDKKQLQREIRDIKNRITYVEQRERLGFGHAVWLCRKFTQDEPVLLLLGDFLYKSNQPVNCCNQIINAFVERGKTMVSIQEVPVEKIEHYGILCGKWENPEETIMQVDKMVEKPTCDFGREYLGVESSKRETQYYATFGQYVLTTEVFDELEKLVKTSNNNGEEIQLTTALAKVSNTVGLDAFLPDGKSYDIGLPEEYYHSFVEYCK